MTARLFPSESRRGPVSAAIVLLLVVCVLLVGACVTSPAPSDKIQIIPDDQYIFFEHHINTNGVSISGECAPLRWIDFPFYSYDKNSKVLTVRVTEDDPVNKSLLVFYGSGKSLSGAEGAGAMTGAYPVYGLPISFEDNVTLDTITADGTIIFHYNSQQISLKPNESWENITRVMQIRTRPDYRNECTEEIITTDRFYNAGLIDKKTVVLHVLK